MMKQAEMCFRWTSSLPAPFLCASVHSRGEAFNSELRVKSQVKWGVGKQQERCRPHVKLTCGGGVCVYVYVLGGLNKTKPAADCGPPLRILKLHSLQRGFCVSAHKCGRKCIFYGGACAPSVAVSWQRAASHCPGWRDEKWIKEQHKKDRINNETELRLQMVLLQACVCGYSILGCERVEIVFILWSLSALVLDIITPRVYVWSLNISVLLSSAGMVPYWRRKKRKLLFKSWCFVESSWKDG